MNGWLLDCAEIAIVFFALLALNFLLKKALLRFKRKAPRENDWRMYLDDAAFIPAQALLWVFFLAFLIDLAARKLQMGTAFSWIMPLRNVAIVLILAWFFFRWKKIFYKAIASHRVKGKPSFDPISMEILGKVFTLGVLFVSLLVLLQIFGLDIIPLVTFGGIGAAAMAYAGKDVIANFFGGLMLYATRPFAAGDLIELPERKIAGHIEEIGWYFSSIRDSHKQSLYIPNSIFSTEVVQNLSRMTHRKIEESIGIRYADVSKIQPILEKIRKLFELSPEIDSHQPINVHLNSFGPFALELEVKAYTFATRYEEFMEIKQKILLEIYKLVVEEGAEIAFPNLKLDLRR